jgi:hypothetical protein
MESSTAKKVGKKNNPSYHVFKQASVTTTEDHNEQLAWIPLTPPDKPVKAPTWKQAVALAVNDANDAIESNADQVAADELISKDGTFLIVASDQVRVASRAVETVEKDTWT